MRVVRRSPAVIIQVLLVVVVFVLLADGMDLDPTVLVALAMLLASPRHTWTLFKRLFRREV